MAASATSASVNLVCFDLLLHALKVTIRQLTGLDLLFLFHMTVIAESASVLPRSYFSIS